jgi:hypothetical protein
MLRVPVSLFLILGLCLAGCSDSLTRDACERLILCAAQVKPDSASILLQTYGPDGTCRKADRKGTLCNELCRGELKKLASLGQYSGACAECEVDADCTSPLPACDTDRGRCVQCSEDSHCEGTVAKYGGEYFPSPGTGTGSSGTKSAQSAKLEVCDATRGVCVECDNDTHCKDPARPFCDGESHFCYECYGNNDCGADKPYCIKPDTFSAYGARYCAECVASSECPPARPVCDASHFCTGCTSGSDCLEGSQCIGGGCKQTCSSVLSCLEKRCEYGCDPNQHCDLLKCPAAVGLAKCVAQGCPDCYKDGFYSYGCDQCIQSKCGGPKSSCTQNTTGC